MNLSTWMREVEQRIEKGGAHQLSAAADFPKALAIIREMRKALEFYKDNQRIHQECVATKNGGERARVAIAKADEIAGG